MPKVGTITGEIVEYEDFWDDREEVDIPAPVNLESAHLKRGDEVINGLQIGDTVLVLVRDRDQLFTCRTRSRERLWSGDRYPERERAQKTYEGIAKRLRKEDIAMRQVEYARRAKQEIDRRLAEAARPKPESETPRPAGWGRFA